MPIHLTVRHPSGHRFLQHVTVTLTRVGGAALPMRGSGGNHVFTIDPAAAGDHFTLEVTVSAPPRRPPASGPVLPPYTHPICHIVETLALSAVPRASGPPLLVLGYANTAGRFVGQHNPRCSDIHAATSTSGDWVLELDLTFLDVSGFFDFVRGTHLVTGLVDGCKLRLLQFTTGGHDDPPVWTVVIPPAVGDHGTGVGAVMFFTPEDDPYSDIETFSSGQLVRYVRGQERAAWPFWVDRAPDVPATPFFPVDVPRCRYARQLRQSGKRVLLMIPMNGNADYGVTAHPGATDLIRTAAKSLWADGEIAAAEPTGVSVTRIAVSGFSYGGDVAFDCWSTNQSSVDELYLCDPNTALSHDRNAHPGASGPVHEIAAWFHGGRKLRLIGGEHLDDMLHYASDLGITIGAAAPALTAASYGDGSVWPNAATFWERSTVYRSCFKRDAFETLSGVSVAGTAAENALSSATGVYVDDIPPHTPTPGDVSVRLRGIATTGAAPSAVISNASHAEVAHLVWRFRMVGTGSLSFSSIEDDIRHWPPPRHRGDIAPVPFMRHQWCVFGGQSADDTMTHFVGYLQHCLAGSGF